MRRDAAPEISVKQAKNGRTRAEIIVLRPILKIIQQ
jgi:hypothetical protein